MIGVILSSVSCETVTHFFIRTPFSNVIVTDENGRMLADVCCDRWRQFVWQHDAKNFTIADALSIIQSEAGAKRLLFSHVRASSRFRLIPKLDAQGHVVGVDVQGSREGHPVQAQGLIMAGGFGRRLGELTKDRPKPMLLVGEKPIAEHLLDNLVDSGINDIFMSVHYCKDALMDYFGNGGRHDANVRYIHENKPLGTGGCLSLINKEISAPLLVVNGDIYTDLQFHRLIDHHNASGADITITVKRHAVTVPYGVIETNDYGNFVMREKPTFSHAINAAIYVLSPHVLNKLEHGVRIDMPALIQQLVSLGAKINLFPLMETWIDIGSPPELNRARLAAEAKPQSKPKVMLTEDPSDHDEFTEMFNKAAVSN
jgi:dTDP-glucose pyrophosphorylase